MKRYFLTVGFIISLLLPLWEINWYAWVIGTKIWELWHVAEKKLPGFQAANGDWCEFTADVGIVKCPDGRRAMTKAELVSWDPQWSDTIEWQCEGNSSSGAYVCSNGATTVTQVRGENSGTVWTIYGTISAGSPSPGNVWFNGSAPGVQTGLMPPDDSDGWPNKKDCPWDEKKKANICPP